MLHSLPNTSPQSKMKESNVLKTKFKRSSPFLHHTMPCNLIDPGARLQFLKDFIAIVKCLADGNAPIGYLRREGRKIHQQTEDEDEGEEVLHPPQEVLDAREEMKWREYFAKEYAL
jgi:hypothetical protein